MRVIGSLQEAGYEAYLVGGAVRDLLLDITPKDYDIATSATPEEVKGVFRRRCRIIGRRFRLAHVYADSDLLEVSTFRREPTLEERKGRQDDDGLMVWRDNAFGSLSEDARRRDFTVNAIFYDPIADGGRLIDEVGGLEDIEKRIVRTIGEPGVRMEEDPVRMLRACKLMGQYNFQPEPQLRKAILDRADQIELSSDARLLEELFKIFKKPYMQPTLQAAYNLHVLDYFLPAISEAWDSEVGDFLQACLTARDKLQAKGVIFPSRITGVATMALPFLIDDFGDGNFSELWENGSGINKRARHIVRDIMSPYKLPRYALAKTVDTLLVQPKLLAGTQRKRTLSHPEYDRGRDCFATFVHAAGLPDKLLNAWPKNAKQSKDSKPQKKRRRRRRKRKQQS